MKFIAALALALFAVSASAADFRIFAGLGVAQSGSQAGSASQVAAGSAGPAGLGVALSESSAGNVSGASILVPTEGVVTDNYSIGSTTGSVFTASNNFGIGGGVAGGAQEGFGQSSGLYATLGLGIPAAP